MTNKNLKKNCHPLSLPFRMNQSALLGRRFLTWPRSEHAAVGNHYLIHFRCQRAKYEFACAFPISFSPLNIASRKMHYFDDSVYSTSSSFNLMPYKPPVRVVCKFPSCRHIMTRNVSPGHRGNFQNVLHLCIKGTRCLGSVELVFEKRL